MERVFLNTEQAAEMIAATSDAVRLLAHRRKIPHLKRGRRLLFEKAEILKWLEAQRRVTTEQALAD